MSTPKHISANPTFRHAAGAGVGVFGGASPAAKAAAHQSSVTAMPALMVPTSLRVPPLSQPDTALKLDISTGATASLDFYRHGLRFRLTRRGDGKVHSWTEMKLNSTGSTEDRALSREETQYALALASAEMDPAGNPAHRDLLLDFQKQLPRDAFPQCKAHLDRSNPDLSHPDLFTFNRGQYKYIIGIRDPQTFSVAYQLHTGLNHTRSMTPEERSFACQVISRELSINDNLIHRTLLDRLKTENTLPAPAP